MPKLTSGGGHAYRPTDAPNAQDDQEDLMLRRPWRKVLLVVCAVLLVAGVSQASALAATSRLVATGNPVHRGTPAGTAGSPGPVRLANPGAVLPAGWQRSSDVAVAVSGDSAGLHVLAATETSGYAWRTVATLGDPAVETDLWIGQACVTASGGYAVVVYAPEQADNMAQAQGVLGRAAIVNLRTGAVKDLGGGFSIAYFDPGCGTGSQAVLTRGGWANDSSNAAMSTTLVVADASTGKVSAPVTVDGQVTSAVPYQGQIAAAGGRGLEQVSTSGKTRLLATSAAVPFELTPGADGSLGYQTMAGKRVDLWHLTGGHSRQVASAAAGSVELRQIGGQVWLVGPQASKVAGLPAQWGRVDAPVTTQMSSAGMMAVTSAEPVAPAKGRGVSPFAAEPVGIRAQLLGGSRGSESFEVPAASASAAGPGASAAATAKAAGVQATTTADVQPASRAASGAVAATPGSPTTPVSADRTCAIPINDPSIQAYQPTFQQVEWAADQAVQNRLTDNRPANVYGNSLPSSYTPQGSNGLFPLPAVLGGGSLPAQVLLGVLTQESNLQQASQHVIQGQTSNPLTSFNWYGNWTKGETDDTGLINWSNSDCGYGIGQITSGMCLAPGQNGADQCSNQGTAANPGLTTEQQLAVSVDYQANIAAAAADLINEWNTLGGLGIYPTDAVSGPADTTAADYIGMWYMAIWAYNSGIEPGTAKYGNTTGCSPGPTCTDNGGSGGNWGLGYADNPINPAYPPDRPVFPSESSTATPTGTTYSVTWDMSHPQYWPYQEKVMGWAFDSITLWDYNQGAYVQAFAYAHGNNVGPAFDTFCVPGNDSSTPPGNNCDPSGVNTSLPTAPDSCQLANDHCWWHHPVAVDPTDLTHGETPNCVLNDDCGLGQITYPAGTAEPANPTIAAQFAQTCASTLPSNAVIVGEGGRSALGCPGQNWTSQGSFTWNFAPDVNGNYSSKMAFDQIGAGFGGHFWFGYAQPADIPTDTVITGTWNPPSSVSGWTDIRVAIPSYGANAAGALYQISPGGGAPAKDVQIDQSANSGTNTWVDLGEFDLDSGASVSLSNVTPGFAEVTPVDQDIAWSAAAFIPVSGPTWSYTAMGDSYSSGEGNPPYDKPNDGCDRSQDAYGRQFATNTSSIGGAGIQHIACSGATIANLTTTSLNGEQPQISQMYTRSELVTVTIGGNDAGFAKVLTKCLTTPTSCESYYNADNDDNEYTLIDSLRPELTAAYTEMRERAPDAKIVAVTYPNIFQPGATCAGINNMPVPDVQFLISATLYLDDTIVAAAQDAGINVMDERYAFVGHELCSSDPWVYSLPIPFPSGTQVLDTSAWFHPTAEGQGQIAADLATYWQQLKSGQTAAAPSSGWLPSNLPGDITSLSTARAEEMLAELPRVSSYATGYAPGAAYWNFTTRDGCDTRNSVLRAQALTTAQWSAATQLLPQPPTTPLCPVIAGAWQTPYDVSATAPTSPLNYNYSSQKEITSGKAGPPAVPGLAIDHVVPKENAWITGAYDWQKLYGTTLGTQMLRDFSNDMSGPELLVVSSSSNSSKQSSGPQQWMPDNKGMTCAYVKMWIAVKWDWDLGVSTVADGTMPHGPTELAMLQNTLSTC
jgi:lysophospholipase L1-like esterase